MHQEILFAQYFNLIKNNLCLESNTPTLNRSPCDKATLCLQRCPSVIFSQSLLNEHMCYTSALKILLIKHGGVQPFAGKVNASLSSAVSLVACLHPLLTIETGCQTKVRQDCRRGPWDVFMSVNAHTHPLPVHQKTDCSAQTRPLDNHVSYILTLLQEHITKHLQFTNQACCENKHLGGLNAGRFM